MVGIILCIFAAVIIAIAAVVVTLGVKILKDIGWWKNFTWWPRSHKDNKLDKQSLKYNCDIEGALDRLHERELQFQQKEAARKKAASRPSMFKFVNTRITLRDIQDYVKQYPPVGQMQCTGCHAVCKDDCDHTCGGNCSIVCNNSCRYACVGACGGSCSTSCGDCTGSASMINGRRLGE